jgi:Rv0078B-related antitoxin
LRERGWGVRGIFVADSEYNASMDASDEKLAIAAQKLRVALDLQRFGIVMMRQNFIRRHPGESEAEIDARFRSWLRDRPMDAPGRAMTWDEWKASRNRT